MLGLQGWLRFTPISQAWLRETAKLWPQKKCRPLRAPACPLLQDHRGRARRIVDQPAAHAS